MATPTKTNTASLYASNPTTSSSVGTSLSGLSFCCEGIPLLNVKHPKTPPGGGQTVIFKRIEQSRCLLKIDFYGMVTGIAGSFHEKWIS
jgi:hypothetical protein